MHTLGPGARAVVVVAFAASLATSVHAQVGPLLWSKRLLGCEPPAVFYSALHQTGRRPCCPAVEGLCPGGMACPQGGLCPSDGSMCVPGPIASRPNVVLLLSDDQGECHWGTAGECRSVQSGTPIPPPATPNLDLLAGYGTVFPIAHNTASWCFPSIDSLLTGRYARNYGGRSRIADRLTTIPKALRGLDGDPGALPDPYNDGNRIGGYCTFLGGKLTSSIGDHGFDAVAKGRKLGRTECRAGASGGEPPRCGSESADAYDPTGVVNMQELFKFLDAMFVRVPDRVPAEFTVQHFFTWLAPRIPHQPLSAPPVIETYLFGGLESPALGGLFRLGQYCGGGVCPPVVDAFKESNFGNGRAYYANVWWADDIIRDLRRYFARASAPHCIDATGHARFDVVAPADCPGTWASSVSPDLTRNTVLVYLSDNGWFLPDSKHNFTENGYRTRMLVFDPRPLPTVPGWDATQETLPPNERFELGHATDVLATVVGFALGTAGAQDCPMADDGTRCDGRDLRPYLAVGASGVPSSPLRHALCGHETKRPRSPTRLRYLLTRPGSVGRCIDLSAPPCAGDAGCGGGATCIGGHCIATTEPACASASECAPGAACLGGRCRPAPSCIDDAACTELFPTGSFACLDQQKKWCRNAPGVACSSHADCPPCPAGPGPTAPPCGRVCEPRELKLYVTPRGGVANVELTDLFLDPDEDGLHSGSVGTLAEHLSRPNGPYASTIARLNCCIDAWWPEVAAEGSLCAGGCPPDFSCTE